MNAYTRKSDLNHVVPMGFPITLDTVKWPIIYIEGSQVISSKKIIVFLSLNLANSAYPGEMSHYAAFHLGLQCLSKYQFRGFQYTKC